MSFGSSQFLVDDMISRPPGYDWGDMTHYPLALYDKAPRNRRCLLLAMNELLHFDIPSKAEHPQRGDSIPVEIEFIPGQAMAGSLGMSVMIVVPALTKGE